MKIKNYEKSALSNAQVALNANEERLISTMNLANEPGTKDNPYSMWEMCEMIKNGSWQGGYVLFMGKVQYIEKDQFVLGDAKDGSSNYTIVPNDDDDASDFVEPPYLDPNLPIFKPSSDFDISQAGHSSESSNLGSNIAISGQDYNIYHEEIGVTNQCRLSVDQTVFEKTVFVSISTVTAYRESDIPTMRCVLQTANRVVDNVIYQKSNSTLPLKQNTLIAKFGYYRIDGQQVFLLVDGEGKRNPVYITTY